MWCMRGSAGLYTYDWIPEVNVSVFSSALYIFFIMCLKNPWSSPIHFSVFTYTTLLLQGYHSWVWFFWRYWRSKHHVCTASKLWLSHIHGTRTQFFRKIHLCTRCDLELVIAPPAIWNLPHHHFRLRAKWTKLLTSLLFTTNHHCCNIHKVPVFIHW